MEQRPLRLGDTVDDYCPRERRVTNHVIVAIVEDAIRQTRCTTCDADHTFRGVRESRRKRKDDAADDAAIPGQLVPPRPAAASEPSPATGTAASAPPAPTAMSAAPADDDETSQQPDGPADHFLSHRRLIRATLPRTEADLPPARPIPEFTMHQRPFNRSGHRHGWHGTGNGSANGNGNGNVNGNVPGSGNGNGNARHQHGRGPGPGGQGQGQGHGHPRRHRGGKQHRPR